MRPLFQAAQVHTAREEEFIFTEKYVCMYTIPDAAIITPLDA